MTIALGIALGLGLSAACGFRIFVPMLALSAAAHAGQVALAPGFDWIGTDPALIVFAIAAREDQLFDLLPRASRAARGQVQRRLIFAAGVLCVAMFSAAVYLPLQTKYDDLASLDALLARARADAGKVDEMRQQVLPSITRWSRTRSPRVWPRAWPGGTIW